MMVNQVPPSLLKHLTPRKENTSTLPNRFPTRWQYTKHRRRYTSTQHCQFHPMKYHSWPNMANGTKHPAAPKDGQKTMWWRWRALPWAGNYPQTRFKFNKGNQRRVAWPGRVGPTKRKAPGRAIRLSDKNVKILYIYHTKWHFLQFLCSHCQYCVNQQDV